MTPSRPPAHPPPTTLMRQTRLFHFLPTLPVTNSGALSTSGATQGSMVAAARPDAA